MTNTRALTLLSKKTKEESEQAYKAYYKAAQRLVDRFDNDPDMAHSIAHLIQEEVERALNPSPTFWPEPRPYEKTRYENIEALGPDERVALIQKWSSWFYDNTAGWSCEIAGDLGMQLAYLFAAISKGTKIECNNDSPLIHCLKRREGYDGEKVPYDAEIWHYIDIVDEEGVRHSPEEA